MKQKVRLNSFVLNKVSPWHSGFRTTILNRFETVKWYPFMSLNKPCYIDNALNEIKGYVRTSKPGTFSGEMCVGDEYAIIKPTRHK